MAGWKIGASMKVEILKVVLLYIFDIDYRSPTLYSKTLLPKAWLIRSFQYEIRFSYCCKPSVIFLSQILLFVWILA